MFNLISPRWHIHLCPIIMALWRYGFISLFDHLSGRTRNHASVAGSREASSTQSIWRWVASCFAAVCFHVNPGLSGLSCPVVSARDIDHLHRHIPVDRLSARSELLSREALNKVYAWRFPHNPTQHAEYSLNNLPGLQLAGACGKNRKLIEQRIQE